MQLCIYCLAEFDEAPKEHVIHAFLGARWKDDKLICKSCQSEYADGIDVKLAERLQPFRLLLGTEGDHGGTGKPLKGLLVSSGETIDLEARGMPKIVRPYIELIKEGEQLQIHIKGGREEHLDWALHKIRKAHPNATFDSEQIKRLGVKKRERLAGEVKIDLNLGGLDFFRAMLKCCANLFAAHDPAARNAFLGTAFDAARKFVRYGTGQMSDFARWLTSGDPLQLPQRGLADQIVILTARGGSVEGIVQFFGHLPFAVRLTTSYAGPQIRCAYVVDPYREADPAEQRLAGAELAAFEEHIPKFAEQSPGNNEVVQAAWSAAINRFMVHYTARENEEVVQNATNEAIRIDSRLAAMPRDQVVAMVRKTVQSRLERLKRTGNAEGITVVRTEAGEKHDRAE